MYVWNDFSFKNVLGAGYNQVHFIVRNLRYTDLCSKAHDPFEVAFKKVTIHRSFQNSPPPMRKSSAHDTWVADFCNSLWALSFRWNARDRADSQFWGGVTLGVKLIFVFSVSLEQRIYEAGLWQENYLNSLRNFYLDEILTFYHFWGEELDLIFTQ